MFKKNLYYVCPGEVCQAYADGENTVLITRDDGRILKRLMTGGKAYGARKVSYADGYFESETAAAELLGNQITLRPLGD